jgi:hypothetical protein
MQQTCTVLVQSFKSRDCDRRKTYRRSRENKYHCMTFFPLVAIREMFLHKTENHKSNCVISSAQNTTALQLNVFLNVINQLLVTNKGVVVFRSANIYQGQLQTPQSLTIPLTSDYGSYGRFVLYYSNASQEIASQ